MKREQKIVDARKFILMQTLAILMAPTAILSIIYSFNFGIVMPKTLIVTVFLGEPILIILVLIYRFYKKHDEKLVQKWQRKRDERFQKQKTKAWINIGGLQTSDYYAIKYVSHELEKICVFKITFHNKIIRKAKPVVTINDVLLTIDIVNDYQILCYAQKAIRTIMENFVIKIGSVSRVVSNPYYISKDISNSGIIWQCEGHSEEKNIYIDEKFLPHRHVDTLYAFAFFANGKHLGRYQGRYIPEKKSIIINIDGIDKHQCEEKECMIKSVLDTGRRILLPNPEVFYVNNKMTKPISFS